MQKEQLERLKNLAGGNLLPHCSMADHTTFRVGGTIGGLLCVEKTEELIQALQFLEEEGIPWFVLGRGSNLLVMDGDLPWVGVRLTGTFCTIQEEKSDEPMVAAGAGASLVQLLEFCRSKGYGGAEFLAGIPGTVGGAAVMNAGAFGKEMASLINGVHLVTHKGAGITADRQYLSFRYRKMDLAAGAIVTRALLKVKKSTPGEVAEKIKLYLGKRKKMQPLEYPSAGSIFKNPEGDHAGRLVEAAGLKGKMRGGAMISTKHGNWIVNTGKATAQDIFELITVAREEVLKAAGIELDLEIRVIGK